jgi:outer membrane protein assembly factor BamB
MRRVALSLAAIGLAAVAQADPCAAWQETGLLGKRPGYTDRTLSAVPNEAAMTNGIWSPGLDDGYIPQGLAVLDGAIFVGTYRSEDTQQGRGPCRIYRLDPKTGAIDESLDLPLHCGHAGGLARGRPGRLWVADTRDIFEIEIAPGRGTLGRVVGSIRLAGDLKGSFAAGTADALWLGTYAKESGARLYKLPFTKLSPGAGSLSEQDAEESVTLPAKVQGAAFDAAGRLWVTRSGSAFGELLQLDRRTGAVLKRFAMPAGIEDISFDREGGLWSVSEAGSKRWLGWNTFFPVVFRLEPDLLR